MSILFNKMNQKCKSDMYHDIINCLVAAMEAKDKYTYGHSNRVADMAYDIGAEMGLKGMELDELHMAAHVHDIGKIGVPENILLKKEKLLQYEWEEIKKHPVIGHDILMKSKDLIVIARIVLHHHERWDGSGYPDGLKAGKIPFGSRVIAVCDSIDAMISDRPYRKALSWEQCKDEIMSNKGRQFDPDIEGVVLKLMLVWQKKLKIN